MASISMVVRVDSLLMNVRIDISVSVYVRSVRLVMWYFIIQHVGEFHSPWM